MSATNVNIVNAAFEEIFCHILNKEAPMGIVQVRTKYNSWITEATKVIMLECDKARLKARMTYNVLDWLDYRKKRNDCTNSRGETGRNSRQSYLRI